MTQFFIALLSVIAIIWIFRAREKKERASAKTAWLTETEKPDLDKEKVQLKTDLHTLDYSEINRAYRVADMHFSRGDFEEAEKWLIKVLALHDSHPESLNCLGVIYVHQNNLKKAGILYRKLLSITQKEPTYYCNYGRCLYSQGKFAEAIEAYENAIKLDCTKPARFISLGQIHYERQNYAKALSCFVKAIELDPQNLTYLSQTAQLAEITGDNERLHRCLKKTVELDPYNEDAKTKLAGLKKE